MEEVFYVFLKSELMRLYAKIISEGEDDEIIDRVDEWYRIIKSDWEWDRKKQVITLTLDHHDTPVLLWQQIESKRKIELDQKSKRRIQLELGRAGELVIVLTNTLCFPFPKTFSLY